MKKKSAKESLVYRNIPCSPSELLSDTEFVQASELLRTIAADTQKYANMRAYMVRSQMIQNVHHGFLSSRPYVQLASCISQGQRNGCHFNIALLSIGFWMDQEGETISSLGEQEFHVVWSPGSIFELLKPPYEVFLGSYEHATMSIRDVFSLDLVVSRGVNLSPTLGQILCL